MNLSQIMRKARFEVDAIRASGTTSALWSDEEVIDAANTAMDRAAKLIRLADSNILVKAMKSTDATVDMVSEVYAPSSLTMVVGQVDYTLPADFVRVETIRTITTDYEGIRFHPATVIQKGWTDQAQLVTADLSTIKGGEQIYYYTLIGPRTLRIRPVITEAFDIELIYQYRPARLQNYSAGTVQLILASTTVRGVGTNWLVSGIRDPADLVLSAPSAVTMNAVYPRVSSVTDDVTAVLAKAWPSQPYNGIYHLSMIPRLPEEHHAWLAQVTAAEMLRKVSPDLSKAALEQLDKQLNLEVQPEVTIRQVQASIPVDEYTLP